VTGDLAPVLREAVRTGDYAPAGALLAGDAVLRTSSERDRRVVSGRAAIVEHLSGPGPGEILDWDGREWPAGVALERVMLADGTALVAKRAAPGADWLARATRDEGRMRDVSAALRDRLAMSAPSVADAERETEPGIASGLVQYGWIFGHSARIHPDPEETAWAREELAWWVPRVRRALEGTGGMPA
jgi:hypothetical protein